MSVGAARQARGRRRTPAAVQPSLFDVDVRPERRYFRQILDALARSGFGADALDAERTISRLCGVVWASQVEPRDGTGEEVFGLSLVEFARALRTPVAMVLLRTLAVVDPIREVRDAAARAADAMHSVGMPEPTWQPGVGAVIPGRCWAYEDAFGDHATVICEFGYRAGPDLRSRHATLVTIDHSRFSVATEASLAEDVDAVIRDFRVAAKSSGPLLALGRVDPEWAHAILARAFARTDLIAELAIGPAIADARAIILARIATLPQAADSLPAEASPPTQEQRHAIVDEFLASAEASALAEPRCARAVADLIVDYAGAYDPARLIRVSPGKWEVFLHRWLPATRTLSPENRHLLPDTVRAWSVWAGRRANLSAAMREELATCLDDLLDGSG